MPKNNAECGKRDERELVKDLKARGYQARRQPGSGNVDPTLPHDVVWEDSPIGKLLIECKWRATCGWRTLLKWMEGAPILTVKCVGSVNDPKTGRMVSNPEGERYVFMRWDTFMDLVGSAIDRSEVAADLPSVEPDKPWVTESIRIPTAQEIDDWERKQRRIQSAYHPPPQRKPKPRGWGK